MVKNKSKENNFIVWRLFGIPISVPINEVALQPAPPVAALTPPWQNCVVVTYTAWSTKPKTLTIWPFTQKVGWLLFHDTEFGGGLLHSSSWLYNTSYYCLTLACEEGTNANLTCTWCIWAKKRPRNIMAIALINHFPVFQRDKENTDTHRRIGMPKAKQSVSVVTTMANRVPGEHHPTR